MKKKSIAPDVVLPPGVNIAGDATIDTGTLLTPELVIETNVRIDRGVTFAGGGASSTRLAANVQVGAGAVIGPNVEIGWGAQVLPGSVVLSSIPANAIVSGNPARIIGYTHGIAGSDNLTGIVVPNGNRREMLSSDLGIGNSKFFQMPRMSDLRGSLSVGELGEGFPFIPKRYFVVFDVPSEELRGEHAHRECQQFLICVRGSCRALLDDGSQRKEVVLDQPDLGLYMPSMIWGTQYRYTRDAVLLVFASHAYDSTDYIRTYDAFLSEVSIRRS